jgi:hypothetical protein
LANGGGCLLLEAVTVPGLVSSVPAARLAILQYALVAMLYRIKVWPGVMAAVLEVSPAW